MSNYLSFRENVSCKCRVTDNLRRDPIIGNPRLTRKGANALIPEAPPSLCCGGCKNSLHPEPTGAPALPIGAPNNQSAAGPPHPGGVSGTGGEKPSSHLNAANASSSPARAGGMSAPPRPPDLRELVHAEHQTCKHLTCDA